MLGLQDNFASCFGWLRASAAFDVLRPQQRSLFHKDFLKLDGLQSVRACIQPFDEWACKLKTLRHPVAHGIPLSIPPAIIDATNRAEFDAANAAYQAEFNAPPPTDTPDRGDAYEAWGRRVEDAKKRMEEVGHYRPWIHHDPRAGFVPIYPTVPEDIGTTVRLARALLALVAQPGDEMPALASP